MKKKISEFRISVALAWLRGDITLIDAARKLRIANRQNAAPRIAYYLREAYKRGLLSDKRRVPVRGIVN
jgi:hypothetical protein